MPRFIDHITGPTRERPQVRSGYQLIDTLVPKSGQLQLTTGVPPGKFQQLWALIDRVLAVADDVLVFRVSFDGGRSLDTTLNSWSYYYQNFNYSGSLAVSPAVSANQFQLCGTAAAAGGGSGVS